MVIQCAEGGIYSSNADEKPKITDTVNQEGFHVGIDRGITCIPETNQQV